MTQPKLLWVDDDGLRGRFKYEERVLKQVWSIVFAQSVYGAAEALSSSEYDAILLDQTLPFKDHGPSNDIWGGCALLWWLARSDDRPAMPRDQIYRELFDLKPLPKNCKARVCVVSAFDDLKVATRMREARADLVVHPKPIDMDVLQEFLRAVPRGVTP